LIQNTKLYDSLKFLAQVGLPAAGAAYFALAGIWGLPAAEQVVGTIVVVDTFLGTVLQISSAKYNPEVGEIEVNTGPTGKKTVSLEVDGDPIEELEGKEKVQFKVKKTSK